MYLNEKVKDIVYRLSQDTRFEHTKIITAYPDSNKPTRLKQIVVCVSPSSVDAENIAVGEAFMYGRYSVDIDVFVPQNFGSPCVQTAVQNLMDALRAELPVGIKVSQIQVNNSLFCYSVNCCLTFCGEIDFGGGKND